MASPEGDMMKDDERTIRKNYQTNYMDAVWVGGPLIAASALDTKWVIAVSAIVIVINLILLDQRLHDLCVRHLQPNIDGKASDLKPPQATQSMMLGFSNGPGGVKPLPVQRTPGSTSIDDH